MRRRRGVDLGSIIFILIVFGAIAENILPLLFILLPLGFMGIIGYAIYKALSNKNNNSNKNVDSNNSYENTNYSTNNISNSDLNKIDKKLTSYFKNNMNLPIIEGISLTTQAGKFTTVDQLFLTYKDEKIIKLVDFKKKYGDVYLKIMNLLLVFANKNDEVIKEEVKNNDVSSNKTANEGDEYIEKINELNSAIPQEEITNGLYQTCDLLKEVNLLNETYNDKNKVSKLYDYYLPILVSVLEKYKKLQDSKVHGEEFKECETQLIKTIVLINEALKTICASMQEDDYMNINADIDTLQSLLEKDGYGESPFGGDKK